MDIDKHPMIASLGDGCCGCGACAASCPKGCVSLISDSLGFRYSEIDFSRCVACGSCDRVCPAFSNSSVQPAKEVLWACSLDEEERLASSSGGLFGLLAMETLSSGGTVYGAAFSSDLKEVSHIRVDSMASLDSVMRSKYVQSVVARDVYSGVAKDLREDRNVLFCGTACQVSGLSLYLARKRVSQEKLLLLDVICHGVPSPRLWSDWVSASEVKSGAKATNINFRNKESGWTAYSVRYAYEAGVDGSPKVCSNRFPDDWYMKAFLRNASIRESCLKCPAKRSCGSDLTLGDYWGVKNVHPEAFDDKGTSAIIVNTDKGRAALSAIASELNMGASTYAGVLAGNPSIEKSVSPYPERHKFLADVASGMSIDELEAKWTFQPTRAQVLQKKIRDFGGKVKRRIQGMID